WGIGYLSGIIEEDGEGQPFGGGKAGFVAFLGFMEEVTNELA
ncbi:hypothetical protein VU01_10881, partial [Candidatus Electrothrix marina]